VRVTFSYVFGIPIFDYAKTFGKILKISPAVLCPHISATEGKKHVFFVAS